MCASHSSSKPTSRYPASSSRVNFPRRISSIRYRWMSRSRARCRRRWHSWSRTSKTHKTCALSHGTRTSIRMVGTCLRVLLLVIGAWSRSQNNGFFTRINNHLLPMFGEPQPQLTPQSPLFQDIGVKPVDFAAWAASIVKPGDPTDDASRILTFLWHFHALVTGNDNPGFCKGSPIYSPLMPGQAAGTGAPPAQDRLPGSLPTGPGAFFGLDDYAGARTRPRVMPQIQTVQPLESQARSEPAWRRPVKPEEPQCQH